MRQPPKAFSYDDNLQRIYEKNFREGRKGAVETAADGFFSLLNPFSAIDALSETFASDEEREAARRGFQDGLASADDEEEED